MQRPKPTALYRMIRLITRLNSHQRLLIGVTVAALTSFLIPAQSNLPAHLIFAWVAYALTALTLMWITITQAHPRDLPKISGAEDSSRVLILVFVVAAAIASLFAVVALLDSTDSHTPAQQRFMYNTLAITAVASSWIMVHSVFTFRYAHLFYGNHARPDKHIGGLEFPQEPEPDYFDFAYFSFVIGMTSQVSDVAISSRIMRRTALMHGVLSFGFNTIIIALTISGLSK